MLRATKTTCSAGSDPDGSIPCNGCLPEYLQQPVDKAFDKQTCLDPKNRIDCFLRLYFPGSDRI